MMKSELEVKEILKLKTWTHLKSYELFSYVVQFIWILGYYLRLLLEEDSLNDTFAIRKPREFFADLYHRFLLTGKPEMRSMCLQAMTIVYGRHWDEIGPFADMKYLIVMLDKVCCFCCGKIFQDYFH